MKRPAYLLLTLALLALFSVGCSQTSRRVAVIDFENLTGDSNNKYLQEAITEYLTSHLTNSGAILLRDRQDIYLGFAEIHASQSREERVARLRTLGEMIDAEYLVVGSLSRLENNFVLTARLFSVSQGVILPGSSVTRSCTQEYEIYYRAQDVAAFLVDRLRRQGAIQVPGAPPLAPVAVSAPDQSAQATAPVEKPAPVEKEVAPAKGLPDLPAL